MEKQRTKKNIITRRLRERKRKQILAGLSVILSVAMVLGVMLNLMQPANTMTTICGKEEHTHSSACYTQELSCAHEGEEGHEHTSECYKSVLSCGKSEHTHTDACYPKPDPTPEPKPEPAVVAAAAPAQEEVKAEAEPEQEPAPAEQPASEEPAPAQEPEPAQEAEPEAQQPAETPEQPETTPASEGTEPGADVPDAPEAPPAVEDPEAPVEPGEEVPEAPAEPEAPVVPPEPTPIPAVKVESVLVNPGTVFPDETATFSYVAANAAKLDYTLTKNGEVVSSGELSVEETTYAYTPNRTGDYTFELTATGADGKQDSASATLHVVPADGLSVKAQADQRSIFGGDEAGFTLISEAAREDGVACRIVVKQDETVIYDAKEFHDHLSVTTQKFDKVSTITLTVTLEDAAGRTASAEATISCAVDKVETQAQWEKTMKDVKLTGVWADDVVAIAETQLGYRESAENFIIDEDGRVQGWTRYGAVFGMPYEEWCAMFVSFCLDYAQVPARVIPRYGNCQQWIDELKLRGLYESTEKKDDPAWIEPQKGDMIFYDWFDKETGKQDGRADHIGIYLYTDEYGVIHTLEGNHNKGVERVTYEKDKQDRIIGYGLVNHAYAQYMGLLEKQRELKYEGEDYTVTVSYEDEAKIPQGATLKVKELVRLTEKYAAWSPYITRAMDAEWQEALELRRLFEIRIEKDGEEVVPQDKLTVKIEFAQAKKLEERAAAAVYSIVQRDAADVAADEENKDPYRVERLEADAEENEKFEFRAVQFEAKKPRKDTEVRTNVYTVVETRPLDTKELTAESENYTISVLYPREAALPAGTALEVRVPEKDSAEYAALTEAVDAHLYASLEEALGRRVCFAVALTKDGEAVEPAAPVTVRAAFARAITPTAGTELRGFRITEAGAEAQALVKEEADGAITALDVTAEKLGTFGIVEAQAIPEKTLEAEGADYTVRVTCPAEARIPKNAQLQVEEILPESEEYATYAAQLGEKLFNESGEALKFARFFDISFVADGKEIEPEAPVSVVVSYAEAPEAAAVEEATAGVAHFADDGALDVRSEDVTLEATEEEGSAFTFTQDSFSVIGTIITEQLVYEAGALEFEGENCRIAVSYGADAGIPVGAELTVREIEPGTEEYEKYAAAAEAALGASAPVSDAEAPEAEAEAAEESEPAEADEPAAEETEAPKKRTSRRFFDITIVYNGMELEPTEAVRVEITLLDELVDKLDIIHETKDEEIEVPAVELRESESGEVTAVFETESFSVYGVLSEYTLRTYTMTADGATYEITVTYDDDAKIPATARLAVREIEEGTEEYAEYLAASEAALGLNVDEAQAEEAGAGEAMPEGEEGAEAAEEAEEAPELRTHARFFDITILDGETEVEPAAPVRVSIRLVDEIVDEMQVVHAAEQEGQEGYEIEKIDGVVVKTGEEDESTMTFDTDSFSVYGLIYTVEFGWEVNGETYNFTLQGGDSVSFKYLVEVLGIARSCATERTLAKLEADPESAEAPAVSAAEESGEEIPENENSEETNAELPAQEEVVISELTERFVADVYSVEFSNPELLWVGKVEENSIVWDIREKNQLEQWLPYGLSHEDYCEWMTKEIIAPDWALISLMPFDTEEALTITMKNGEQFVVRVTDDQNAIMVPDPNGGQKVQTIANPSGTTIDLFDYWIADNYNYMDGNTRRYINRNTEGRAAWPGHTGNDNFGYDFQFYDYSGNYKGGWHKYQDNAGNWQVEKGYLLGNGNEMGINAGHIYKFTPSVSGAVIDGVRSNGWVNVDGNWVSQENSHDYYQYSINSWTGVTTPAQGLFEKKLVNDYPKLSSNPSLGTNGESLDYLFTPNGGTGKEYKGRVNQLLYVDPDGYYTYDSADYSATYNNDGTFTLKTQTSNNSEVRGFWPFGSRRYWFGMHMNTPFSMPKNGKVLNPRGVYQDMVFEFSGDDDCLLYVDGVLVGDAGGIHLRSDVTINFATGIVTVSGKNQVYLDDLFRAAGKYNDYEWEGHTFKSGTYHTFDMFYLERGGGESNLHIKYNLVSTAEFTAHKSYHTQDNARLARDDFQFELIGFDNTAYADQGSEFVNAIMPAQGTGTGAGTVASPRKEHKNSAPDGLLLPEGSGLSAHTSLIIGVTEDGNVNFGDAQIQASQVGKEYKYAVREVVPNDAVNADGKTWAQATPEEKAEGGFKKGDITYDGKVYYFIGTVEETEPNSGIYKVSKTRYTDSTYTTVDTETKFFNFVNGYVQPLTLKVIKKNNETKLPGAKFSLVRAKLEATTDETTQQTTSKWIAREGSAVKNETTNTNGELTFDNLTEGHYILEETEAPSGYQKGETSKWLLTLTKGDSADKITLTPTITPLNADGTVKADSVPTPLTVDNTTFPYTVYNTPRQEDEPDKIVIDVEKKFTGLLSTNDIPDNFQVVLSYTLSGSPKTITLTKPVGGSSYVNQADGSIVTWSANDFTWHWRVTNIDADATGFMIREANYADVPGYSFTSAKFVNAEITAPDKPDTDRNLNVTAPTAQVSNVTSDRKEPDNNKKYQLRAGEAMFISLTGNQGEHGTLVVSQSSLNNRQREYMKHLVKDKPNHVLQGSFAEPVYFMSVEEHPEGFYYKGCTVTFTWNEAKNCYIVSVEHKQSSMEEILAITYSTNGTTNDADYENIYEENEVTVDIYKTEKDSNPVKYLPGAEFTLKELEEDKTVISYKTDGSGDVITRAASTNENGKAYFAGLTHGYYEIEETKAPAGYIRETDTKRYFKVEAGVVTYLVKEEGKMPSEWSEVDNPTDFTAAVADNPETTEVNEAANASFTIPNTPGVALPATGAVGDALYLLGGLSLLSMAALAVMGQQSKGRKRVRRSRG